MVFQSTVSSIRRGAIALWLCLALLLLTLGACAGDEPDPETAAPAPTQTTAALPTADIPVERAGRDFVVIATDAPLPPFTDFDQFGNVVGYNSSIMENIAARAGLDYEFVVTPHEGVLASIADGSARDFDAVMSALRIPDTPEPGIAYSLPYLEVGQVIMVLVDDQSIQGAADLRPGTPVGVLAESDGIEVARSLGLADTDVFSIYERPSQLVQALVDETVQAVILDSYAASYFVEAFPEQLKIAGSSEEDAWLGRRAYGIAVAAGNTALRDQLNSAITQLTEEGVISRLTVDWLVPETDPAAAVDPGESRVGTPGSELFIGVVAELADMDPASITFDFTNWEIKNNTMSGLYRINVDSEVEPLLASALPAISEDKLEYTISLREGLRFPDGSDLTADDVQWSLLRASSLGNFMVNTYLKDANDDNFADQDAVQVLDPLTVRIVLQEPTAYFPAILATPPFFPISSECYAETADPGSSCGGLGPYSIVSWTPNDRIRLRANADWPGIPSPAFENITVRFYADEDSMLRSLTEFQSTDLAWTGLTYSAFRDLSALDQDADGEPDFTGWEGPSTFKSYIIFEQETEPWDSERVRQAAALSLDRDALARDIFEGARLPLLSPVPNDIPNHLSTLPARDLERARALLLEEGYSPTQKLAIELWYVNDGRYSPVEEAYAEAVKAQLEETNVFEVTLSGTDWAQFRAQISQCAYPAYLLGWPSPGQPVNYLDSSSWTDFFVQSTDTIFCSNYQSEQMDELVAAARAELDDAARGALVGQIQQLWAEELPTLDITQEPRRAISLPSIGNVQVNALGLMHYELLTKAAE